MSKRSRRQKRKRQKTNQYLKVIPKIVNYQRLKSPAWGVKPQIA